MTVLHANAARTPRAGNGRSSRPSWLQATLLIAGGILLPTGLVVIGFGWYGAAHTPYTFDQISFLISGGLLGLGLAFTGGFLYFGSWLAKIAADNNDAMHDLTDAIAAMGESLAQVPASTAPSPRSREPLLEDRERTDRMPAAFPLLATAAGSKLHYPDCSLVRGRDDLRAVSADDPDLKPCQMCMAE